MCISFIATAFFFFLYTFLRILPVKVSSIHQNWIVFFDGDPDLRRDCGALGKAIDFYNGLLLCSMRRCGCASDELSFCCQRYRVHGEMFSWDGAWSAAAIVTKTTVSVCVRGGVALAFSRCVDPLRTMAAFSIMSMFWCCMFWFFLTLGVSRRLFLILAQTTCGLTKRYQNQSNRLGRAAAAGGDGRDRTLHYMHVLL